MNDAPPRFVLLAALDGSASAERTLEAASQLARGITASELHLVHALEPYETEGFPVDEARERELTRARSYLDENVRWAQGRSVAMVTGHLRECPAAMAILQVASSIDADLVMVGTHDRKGLSRWVLGSVSEHVVRDAACPVLVVRPKHHAVSTVPEIEPPCPDCLAVQRESKGAKLWCARHAEHHPRGYLHYEFPEGFGAGSSLIMP